MKKQSIARSLIHALKSRVELDKSLGVDFMNINLPEKTDLSRVKDIIPDEVESRIPKKASSLLENFDRQQTSPAGNINKQKSLSSAGSTSSAKGIISEGLSDITDVIPENEREEKLAPVYEEALSCKKCPLCETRQNVVFGEGDINTDLVFVGEAPGRDEDISGIPFVGRAGEFLTNIVEKGMKRPRESVYTCNIVKCRPPRNRDPLEEEIRICNVYLNKQLEIIHPKLIIALGRVAGQMLSGQTLSIRSLRGRFFQFRGIAVLPIYHPAYLLKARQKIRGTTREDKLTWQDIQNAMKFLEDNSN